METETLLDESLLLSEPILGSTVEWEKDVLLERHHSEIESINLIRGISDPFEFSSEIESSYLMNVHAIQFDEQFCRQIQQSPPTYPVDDIRQARGTPMLGFSTDDYDDYEESLLDNSKHTEYPTRQPGAVMMDLFSKPFTCGNNVLKCGLHGCQSEEEEIIFASPEDYDIDEIPFVFDDNGKHFYSPNIYGQAAKEEDDLFQSMKIHSLSSDHSADTASTDQDLSSDGSNNSKPSTPLSIENTPSSTSSAFSLSKAPKGTMKTRRNSSTSANDGLSKTLTSGNRENNSDDFSQNGPEDFVSHKLTSPSSLSFARNWSTASSSIGDNASSSLKGENRSSDPKALSKAKDYWEPVNKLSSNISDESLPSVSLLKKSASILKKKSSFPRRENRIPSATKLVNKKRSVSFHYPEVSAFKQYAKIEAKDKPILFFTEDELDQAEQDRYDSRYIDDVECVHVEEEENQVTTIDNTLKEVGIPKKSKRKSREGLMSRFMGNIRRNKDKKSARKNSNSHQVLVFLRERSKQ